jgi:hypothetical protein
MGIESDRIKILAAIRKQKKKAKQSKKVENRNIKPLTNIITK